MSRPVRRVAVVGDDGTLRDAVTGAGGTLVPAADADAIVAVGEGGIREAVRSPTDGPPVLPVGSGRYAISRPDVATALRELLAERNRVVTHPLLSVTVDRDPIDSATGEQVIDQGRDGIDELAALDVAAVTDEPARISEYRIGFAGGRTATVRADGVVVATPLGSDGYARAAGGPTLEPAAGVSVVPISPFTTDAEAWVAADAVTLAVERDEVPVSVVVDGDPVGPFSPAEPLRVAADGRIRLFSVPTLRDGER